MSPDGELPPIVTLHVRYGPASGPSLRATYANGSIPSPHHRAGAPPRERSIGCPCLPPSTPSSGSFHTRVGPERRQVDLGPPVHRLLPVNSAWNSGWACRPVSAMLSETLSQDWRCTPGPGSPSWLAQAKCFEHDGRGPDGRIRVPVRGPRPGRACTPVSAFGWKDLVALAALVGLALVDQAPGQPLRQAQMSIDALEQDRAAIRTGVGRVEAGNDRPCESLARDGDLRYTGCGRRASSHLCVEHPTPLL
jgi:hypothetical protein